MHTEHHKWHSPNLNKEMELKIYGHGGTAYIVYPCSCGRFFDFEGFSMIDTVKDFIEAGKIQLYAVDSVDDESWYNFGVLPGDRNARHEEYDRYIVEEVVPLIRHKNPGAEIMGTGCSMGAYHALNFYLKHPDVFTGVVALSGLYKLDQNEFGMKDYDIPYVYYNSPVNYLSGLDDPKYLEQYKQGKIVICVGQGSWEDKAISDTRDIDRLLKEKDVPAWIDYWGHDVNHDWPWWHKQIRYFMDELHG